MGAVVKGKSYQRVTLFLVCLTKMNPFLIIISNFRTFVRLSFLHEICVEYDAVGETLNYKLQEHRGGNTQLVAEAELFYRA